MDDYALVLNAGSSSLKFCVFRRPVAEKWRVEARGQIEGIGTSPRLLAKGTDGKVLAASDFSADVHLRLAPSHSLNAATRPKPRWRRDHREHPRSNHLRREPCRRSLLQEVEVMF